MGLLAKLPASFRSCVSFEMPILRPAQRFPCNLVDGRESTIEGRLSTMSQSRDKIELLRGTLDMLILRTLLVGPAHGHQIAKHIQRSSEDVLQVEHGSLYPALHRLERKGWVVSKWESRNGKREFKYYRLSTAGRKQLTVEESKWKQLVGAIARVAAKTES